MDGRERVRGITRSYSERKAKVDDLPSINLDIPDKLLDPEYRREFFLAEASASIAGQLTALRKLRGFKQTDLAKLVGTQQSGISRIERPDYRNWSFSTLWKIADVLNARLRIEIEPTEAVLWEYEDPSPDVDRASALDHLGSSQGQIPKSSAQEHIRSVGNKNEADKYRSKPSGISLISETNQGTAIRT